MRLALLTLLTACRFGFDATTSSDGGGGSGSGIDSDVPADVRGDGELPAACMATQIASVVLDSPVADIIAAVVPGGTSIGFLKAPSSELYGVFVGDDLIANTSTPHLTSPVQGSMFTYTKTSMFWTGSVLVGATSVQEDGNCYKKIFPTSMELFQYADAGQQCRVSENTIATVGTTTYTTWYEGTELLYRTLAGDGVDQPPDTSFGTVLNPILDVSVASGVTALAVTHQQGNTCEVRQFPTVVTQSLGALTCAAPHVVRASDSSWLATYQAGANLELRSMSYGGASQALAISSATTLGQGQGPRLFRTGGTWLVASEGASTLEIRGIDPVADLTISGLPAGAPDAYEVAGPLVFAAYGSDLFAITCP